MFVQQTNEDAKRKNRKSAGRKEARKPRMGTNPIESYRNFSTTKGDCFMKENVERFWQALWIARLDELRKSLKKELMSFPEVRNKLCPSFHLDWNIIKKFIHKLWEDGYIETSPCHGIKLTQHAEELLAYLEFTQTSWINDDIK